MIKWRFETILQPKYFKQASEFLKKVDIGDFEMGYEQVFTFSSKKDLDINDVKNHIKLACEDCDVNLLHIEGGKIE